MDPELVLTITASALCGLATWLVALFVGRAWRGARAPERLAWWQLMLPLLAVYAVAFWPLVTAVMVYVALPFVLVGLQRSTMGRRIAIGALAGVGFQMLNTTFGTFALAYGVDPRLCALLPTLLALGAGLNAMRLVR